MAYCSVCTPPHSILRPSREAMCSACLEGAKTIYNLIYKFFESEKPMDNHNASHQNLSELVSIYKIRCMKQYVENQRRQDELAFLRSFIDAFRAQIHTDIMVTPGKNGPPVPSHKAVLATRSEVFKNMLDSDECKAAPTNNITIPELNYEELGCLLEFLYIGTLSPEILEKHVYALFLAAHKYGIPYLEKHCARYMVNSLSISNALEVLEIADTCSNQELKDPTMKFLVKNIGEIVLSSGYEAFVHRSPHLAVQLARESAKAVNVK